MLRIDALNNEFSLLGVDKHEDCLCSHHKDDIRIEPMSYVCAV